MYNEIDLINKIKNENSSDALKELVARHSGICSNVFKNHNNFDGALYDYHDFMADRFKIVYDTAQTFKLNKNTKFSTYLHNRIRYYAQNKLKKLIENKEYNVEPSVASDLYEKQLDLSDFDYKKFDLEEINDILESLGDKRICKIFELRYIKDYGWRKIGEELSLSHERVRKIHNNTLEYLKTKLNKYSKSDNILSYKK